jgi:spore germination cell wall hydrolase CwlJ-like protein
MFFASEVKQLQVAEIYPVQVAQLDAKEIEPLPLTFEQLAAEMQKEVRCLAHNIYFEARSEPIEGQLAVAHVTMNRVESKHFPSTICGVVQQQRGKVCQFSWWCSKKLRNQSIKNNIPNREVYNEIKQLALELVVNEHLREDNTEGALFYHAGYVSKKRLGALRLVHTTTIGQHIFYRTTL